RGHCHGVGHGDPGHGRRPQGGHLDPPVPPTGATPRESDRRAGRGALMNAADLMAALNTVEQDHQLLLDKVQTLRELDGYLAEPAEGDVSCAVARLREIHGYFTRQMLSHMDEEETTLFPLLEQNEPGGADLVTRLRQEHEEIRHRLEDFGACLHVAGELED